MKRAVIAVFLSFKFMDTKDKTNMGFPRRTTNLMIVCSLMLLVAFSLGYYCYYQAVDKQKSEDEKQTEDIGSDTNASSDSASDSGSVSELNDQIKTSPNNPLLYVEKSEILYNQGDKDGALDAVNEGLAANPDSEILKSKKDVLEKDYFQSADQDTPRE